MRNKKQECSKIYVKLSNEVIDKLDNIASSRGLSRSGLIAYFVGKSVETELMAQDAMKNITTPDGYGSVLKALGIDENALKDILSKD